MYGCKTSSTAQRASGLKSLEVFASRLGAALEAEMLPGEKKWGSMVHIAGYVKQSGLSHPEFYFVRNIHQMDAVTGEYLDFRDQFLVNEHFWTRDCPKNNLMSAFQLIWGHSNPYQRLPAGPHSLSRRDAAVDECVFANMGNSGVAVPPTEVTRRNGILRQALYERYRKVVRSERLPSAIHWRQNPDL